MSQGDIRSCCTWPGLIWHWVLTCVHAPWFQVKDFDSTFGYSEGRWCISVQPHGSVLSGHRPDQVDQHRCKAMSKQCRLYEGKLQQVHQGLPQGRRRFSKCRQPADLLALYSQEACTHADAQVHATLSAASQLLWGWLPLLHDGGTHGAREEWTNLLCAA